MTYTRILVDCCCLEDGASASHSFSNVDRVRSVDKLRWEVVPDDVDENISSIGRVPSGSSKVVSINFELLIQDA